MYVYVMYMCAFTNIEGTRTQRRRSQTDIIYQYGPDINGLIVILFLCLQFPL